MKKWHTYLLLALLGLALIGSATVAYAQQGDTPPQPVEAIEPPPDAPPFDALFPGESSPESDPLPHHRPLHSLRGEVTAVHESGFSLLTTNEHAVEVNVHSGTKIWLVETQGLGSLADIQVGDKVLVEGCRCGETSVGAQRILVGPDGDEVHGRVTSVDGSTIQFENPDGTATVLTDGDTEFRLGREAASLEDVAEGMFLAAFGQLQSDGSLNARLVIMHPPHEPPVRNVRGEVTAVSSTGLTLAVRPLRNADRDPVSVQVNVTDETQIWLVAGKSRGSLADIQVGDQVVVRGRRAEESTPDAPAMDARQIVVGWGEQPPAGQSAVPMSGARLRARRS